MKPMRPQYRSTWRGTKPSVQLDHEDVRYVIYEDECAIKLLNPKTGKKFTYRLKKDPTHSRQPIMVYHISPPVTLGFGNQGELIGRIYNRSYFELYRSSRYSKNSQPIKVISWFVRKVAESKLPPSIEVWYTADAPLANLREVIKEKAVAGRKQQKENEDMKRPRRRIQL